MTSTSASVPPWSTTDAGCPAEYESGSSYEGGDVVSLDGLVYRCVEEYSLFCGVVGYEPGTLHSSLAWTELGSCSGLLSPTASPNFQVLENLGGCPDEYEASRAYEKNDRVSKDGIVYQCREWPYSAHCVQAGFEPGNPKSTDWKIAWEAVGHCSGDAEPVSQAAVLFDSLAILEDGCPEEYSPSRTNYEARETVSVTVSEEPLQKIVYECRDYPDSHFCNMDVFQPGSPNENFAWNVLGGCTSSMSPTASPSAYSGTCLYEKCTLVQVDEICSPGATGCSCGAGDPATDDCKRDIKVEVCDDLPVNVWSSGADYAAGDVVRIGRKRYKCKSYPYTAWCNIDAYKPTIDSGIWGDAWARDGDCP